MITSFHGEHRWLSNFWLVPITIENLYVAQSVEHAYQASKAMYQIDFLTILKAPTPGMAKKMAKHVEIRSDWDQVKDRYMEKFLIEKFRNPEMRMKLIATGDQLLIEGNTWGDRYWGAVLENDEWVGENKLGKLIMKIRDGLNKEGY